MDSGKIDLLEILKKMFSVDVEKKRGQPGLELEKIEPDSPHGVYMYDFTKEKWVLKQVDGEFRFQSDGYYMIYFDNAKCPACRAYDNYWFPFVKLFGKLYGNVNYMVVLCDWFTRECYSEASISAFKKFDVHASPTTILVKVNDGEVERKLELSGVKKIDELLDILTKFISGQI